MDYQVISVKARTVQKQGQNFGKKYVECTLKDAQGNERIVPVFDAEADKYLRHISTANGGSLNAAVDEPIPAEDAKWSYCFDETYMFTEPMVRIDPQQATPTPLRNKFGQMYVRTAVRVLTRYVFDEQLQLLNPGGSPLSAMRGWDRETRGTSVMNSFYMPERLFNASGPANTAEDPV